MGLSIEACIAIGFPLIIGVAMAVFFPIKLKDYFSDEEIENLSGKLTPYKFSLRAAVYIFIVYIVSASVLGLIQAYLFWHFAAETGGEILLKIYRLYSLSFYSFSVDGCFINVVCFLLPHL